MEKMSSVKKICICAICIALCYVLPLAMHSVGLGSILSPMHIPVLLCGTVCGGFYGAVCGILGPVLSSLLSGMPPAVKLFTMVPELVAYGLACGLLMRRIRTGKLYSDLYISLVSAMLLGRIVGGIAQMIFVSVTAAAEPFTLGVWVTSYFVTAVPGIVAHLVLVPLLTAVLMKARVIPARYSKTAPNQE